MERKFMAILISSFFIVSVLPGFSQAQVIDDVQIKMAGEVLRQRDGMDIMVGGVLHNLTIQLNAPADNITIKAYSSVPVSPTPPIGNISNIYHWSYSNSTWNDHLYTDFINPDLSTIYGNSYSFFLGTVANATPGQWVLSILVDGTEEWNETFILEEPRSGIAFSGPNFYFNIAPYITGFIDSWAPDDPRNSSYFTTTNSGNVPMDFTISYDDYDSLFTTTNSTGISHVQEERIHHIQFQAEKWSPREFTVKGRVHGEPKMLVTPAMISFILAPESAFNVIVKVARPGYDIFQMNGLVVQYKSRIVANYNDELELDMYLTGTKDSHLSLNLTKLTLVELFSEGVEVSQPVYVQVMNDTEVQVIAKINCSYAPPRGQPSMLTYAKFIAETDDFSTTGDFTTTIVVKAKTFLEPDDDIGLGPLNLAAIILIVIGMVSLFTLMVYSDRKTKAAQKEKEEKEIEEKKGGKRRRRKKKWV